MAYEVGGGLYFRRYDGAGWINYLQLETAGVWPSITQSDDGQALMIWENEGSLLMRHYTGSVWEPAQTVFSGNALNKRFYPNLKLGNNAGWIEWASTSCCGAPFHRSGSESSGMVKEGMTGKELDIFQKQIWQHTYKNHKYIGAELWDALEKDLAEEAPKVWGYLKSAKDAAVLENQFRNNPTVKAVANRSCQRRHRQCYISSVSYWET